MECKAFAKINLFLNITGVLPDGYHELCSVMQSINLYDTVTVTLADRISISVDKPFIPADSRNIAFKAAEMFFNDAGISSGADIRIKKIIPVGAGMAGGSADAAAVLGLLNILCGFPLTDSQLSETALRVGADVPFCLHGGTMLAQGKGEKLTALNALPDCYITVVKPPFSVSTKDAYAMFDAIGGDCPPAGEIIDALTKRDIGLVCASMGNDLEKCIAQKHIEINNIKNALLQKGALGAMMTGSGSAVFGIFDDKNAARAAADMLKTGKCRTFVCRPV